MVYKPTSNWRHLVDAFQKHRLPRGFPAQHRCRPCPCRKQRHFSFQCYKKVALLKGNNPKKMLNAHMLCLKNDWKAPNLRSFVRQASVDCTGRCGPSGAKACQRHVLKKSKNDLCPIGGCNQY